MFSRQGDKWESNEWPLIEGGIPRVSILPTLRPCPTVAYCSNTSSALGRPTVFSRGHVCMLQMRAVPPLRWSRSPLIKEVPKQSPEGSSRRCRCPLQHGPVRAQEETVRTKHEFDEHSVVLLQFLSDHLSTCSRFSRSRALYRKALKVLLNQNVFNTFVYCT